MLKTIIEPEKHVPVIEEADICVLGGSCTGVFAAVRAARLGAKVVLIEKQNCLGGSATSGLVNIWHSLMDFQREEFVIAGLTREIVTRLVKRGSVIINEKKVDAFVFNSEELKIELDEIVLETNIKIYLHTAFAAPYIINGNLEGVFIENKSGRSAILAKVFIDCTGDGDLCIQTGEESYTDSIIQPSTVGGKMTGLEMELYGLGKIGDFDLNKAFLDHREEFGIKHDGWGWSCIIPGVDNVTFQAITKITGLDCASGQGLTEAEIEGRRQLRAIIDLIRKYGPEDAKVSLVDIGSYIGIRETRHIKSQYMLKESDCLTGARFYDAVANSTMRVDLHHSDKPGCTFRFMDGRQQYMRSGFPTDYSRWRDELPQDPRYYQIPYRALLPKKQPNLLFAGRMLDADRGAFASARVMVILNQLGEAAGTAAYLAVKDGVSVQNIDTRKLKELLVSGGSILNL